MKKIRIGTRGSPLALVQAQEVCKAIGRFYPELKNRIEIVPLKTTGDTIVDRTLTDVGGKSLFTKEIEEALLKGAIDMAVHSMKDMATEFPPSLIVPAMLEREDPRDALITYKHQPIGELSKGSLFGTSSLRRQAFVLSKYPILQAIPLRGNVQTRLEKIHKGDVQATLLAVAGLKRLGLLEVITEVLSLEEYIPAVGQGAIGIQCQEDDKFVLEVLSSLNHFSTFQTVQAERSFMKALNGSCRTPLAAYAWLEGEKLFIRGMVSDPQGKDMHFISYEGFSHEPEKVGQEAAQKLQEKRCLKF